MRISSSCLGMLCILFGIIAVFLIVIFVPGLLDFLLKYGPYFLAVVMGGGLIYILASQMSAFASVAADEVLAIFLDVNNKDIHLFSGHKGAKTVGGADPDRLIQHYFITAEGKRYYHELFSHRLTVAMGSGEYEGYTSLKESVLNSPALQESLKNLSHKLNQLLALGERISRNNDHLYVIDENREIQISKTDKLYTRQLTVLYQDAKTKNVLWKVKI
jgi:hypothetical protein